MFCCENTHAKSLFPLPPKIVQLSPQASSNFAVSYISHEASHHSTRSPLCYPSKGVYIRDGLGCHVCFYPTACWKTSPLLGETFAEENE